MKELLPVSDRIKGLSDNRLADLYESLITFRCDGLECNDCPFKIKGQVCMSAQVFIEYEQRKA